MRKLQKIISVLVNQIKPDNVKLPLNNKPLKIKDNNQAINNGVINEESDSDLRSQTQPTKRGRGRKPKRQD